MHTKLNIHFSSISKKNIPKTKEAKKKRRRLQNYGKKKTFMQKKSSKKYLEKKYFRFRGFKNKSQREHISITILNVKFSHLHIENARQKFL